MSLHRTPVSFADAREFVNAYHRHHAAPIGYKGCVGVTDDTGTLRGVAIIGRPVARHLDDGRTLEITRVATDSTRNACSLLYAACWDMAKGMGYTRLITYTQQGESGASLRAAGYRTVAVRPPRPGWDRPSRPRKPRGTEHVQRYLWEVTP
ncbi:XF1762 family protein [Streptomyces sp. NPDC006967]|uniref:XF1762 family protein n=1 Tax=unclassified Streptomyces TaxID=2593676 RepID=UPI0033E943A1